MNQYGININKLQEFIATPEFQRTEYGAHAALLSFEERMLERFDVKKGARCMIASAVGREATIFVEEGAVALGTTVINNGETISFPLSTENTIVAQADAVIYLFSARVEEGGYFKKNSTTDLREKYWGTIETIVNKDYAGKRIFCRTGKQSSLEFHCNKVEGYYVHSGTLFVRLRAGRGEDRYFELPAGTTMFVPPGLMHQRGGRKDAVVIELSTRDADSDSFLVEDGATHPMPGLLQ